MMENFEMMILFPKCYLPLELNQICDDRAFVDGEWLKDGKF